MKYNQNKLLNFWPLFFLLAFLEAAACLLALLRIPSEGGGLILGFTATRWALFLPLLAALGAAGTAAYLSLYKPDFRARWLDPASRPGLYELLSLAFPVTATVAGIGSFLLRWLDPASYLPIFERAWPLLAFILVFSIQSALWLLALRFGIHKATFEAGKPALIAFGILLLGFGFVALTKLGTTPDPAYWGEPGVPIQGWQLGLALLGGATVLTFSLLPFFKRKPCRADIPIGTFIWLLAVGIWLSVPNQVLKNSFYFPIDPPTNMPLPYSDSGYYDYMAHSLLIGTDYTGEIPTRPLYIIFLTGLHLLFGENYNRIILGQTLVLALFPVAFYALGKKLHSHTAGVTIALLAIFREWTSLLVASDTRVSNTKILLVDIPTLLLILLACLFAFRWLEKKDKHSAFIAGGTFGILLLLRTQSMLILPILFLVVLLTLRSHKRPWLVHLLFFILGVAISVAPWLTHNYLRIGKFAFDAPFQYQVLASQYAYTGNLDYNSINLEGKGLGQILLTFALKDPGFVAGFITNHFLATEVGGLLALPLIAPFNGLRAPINLYWTSFNGTLAWYNTLLLIVYLGIIAIGLGAAWRRWRWAGLLPLAFNLGYALANGIGRFSGWRYDLPADWIAYFYFGVGFAEILLWLAKVFGAHPSETDSQKNAESQVGERIFAPISFLLVIAFALIGALPWIAESINPPPHYPNLEPDTLQAQIADLATAQDLNTTGLEIQSFSEQTGAITIAGRLLYPRYFGRGTGMSSSTPWPSYEPRDFPRLGFLLLNEKAYEVVFPIKGSPNENVHGEDVLILGCEQENYIEARVLAFPNADFAYLSDFVLRPCSP
ncbi:MAG: glycosyltransferase family 39 protein [Anaerolineales bacterium]|nr:glycosyltransferase family 39 protein [Anaerolineales bacterium]